MNSSFLNWQGGSGTPGNCCTKGCRTSSTQVTNFDCYFYENSVFTFSTMG